MWAICVNITTEPCSHIINIRLKFSKPGEFRLNKALSIHHSFNLKGKPFLKEDGLINVSSLIGMSQILWKFFISFAVSRVMLYRLENDDSW